MQSRYGRADRVIGSGRESREPAVGDFEVEVEEVLRVRVFTEVGAWVEG